MGIKEEINLQLSYLSELNPGFKTNRETTIKKKLGKLQKVVIANRGEIAKRFFLSLREENIPSVAVVTDADIGQSWYEFADEFIRIGNISNYTNIPIITASILLSKANAVYPGYGFLSENPEFVRYIKKAAQEFNEEIIFMGPDDSVMDLVGQKLPARALAKKHGVPLFEGSEAIQEWTTAREIAKLIGYPVIVKLSSGGGGKGMMPVFQESELFFAIESCKRIGIALYNDPTFYLEKYITKPVHIEVQIFNGTAIGIRKCAVQRRNQKVIEETGDFFIDEFTILSLLAAAENMAKISGYANGGGAGTVEFLYDQDSGKIGFLEMNTRLQVEHPVTDQSLGIDLAKWQILQFDGRESEIDYKQVLEKRFTEKDHAIECRIYAEDPDNNYTPSPGKIEELELPTFNGIRCDFGFKKGDKILPYYDPMIGKLIARGPNRSIAIARMERALSELYVKGITTNINQLLQIVRHPIFLGGEYTNTILDENKELQTPIVNDADATLVSVFSSICEYTKILSEKSEELFHRGDIESFISYPESSQLPTHFGVEIGKFKNSVKLLQTSSQSFHIFLNNKHVGEAEVKTVNFSSGEFFIRFGLRSYNVRIDSRHGYSIIRIKNSKNKINYFRVKIYPEGLGSNIDPIGMVRAPFQGSFVKFGRDEHAKRDRLTIGSYVKKGDPVIVISAMKMETVLTATHSGKITYLIENGDLSQLEIGKTPQGQIIGKNISEGEILFVITPSKEERTQNEGEVKIPSKFVLDTPVTSLSPIFEYLVSEVEENSNRIPLIIIISIFKCFFLGYSIDEKVLQKCLKNFSEDINDDIKKVIFLILQFYLFIKKIYAPSYSKELSLFIELNEYIKRWNDESYTPSVEFSYLMKNLFNYYDVENWLGTNAERNAIARSLFYLQRAYFNIKNDNLIFKKIFTLAIQISVKENFKGKMMNLIKNIFHFEESERDNTKSEWIMQEFFLKYNLSIQKPSLKTVSRKYHKEYNLLQTNPIELLCSLSKINLSYQIILDKIQKSILLKQKLDELPLNIENKNLNLLISKIYKNYKIYPLYSPIPDLFIFHLESKKEVSDSRYYLVYDIKYLEKEVNSEGKIVSSPNVEIATILCSTLLKIYLNIEEKNNNQIDILANSQPSVIDLGSSNLDIFQFKNLFQINLSVNYFLKGLNVHKLIIHTLCQSQHPQEHLNKVFQLYVKKGKVVLDLVYENNPEDIYSDGTLDIPTQKLLEKGKWPVEFWVRECFKESSYSEIKISSIDEVLWVNPKTGKQEYKPVGAKIYFGIFGDSHCIFFMKDSRINGGATGDLEGLKYLAALYISHKLKIPVYVWNDGAGANIKEGMISLNRAGQGFMMNSLLHIQNEEKKFFKFTHENFDSRIIKLFQEVEEKILTQIKEVIKSRSIAIAVGIGSSSGLDVYGSSQMALQVMLDDDESYRVLTGSNVIKSVTGEEFTNYQIGGAQVMGKWTGTVDKVAESKLELISILREIQQIFSLNSNSSETKFQKSVPEKQNINLTTPLVLVESTLRNILDNNLLFSLKEEYYGTASLISGLGKLRNIPVCILATRTDYGIRSFSSVIKAKEVCRIASKSGLDKILVFGKRWFYPSAQKDVETLQARKDFLHEYASNTGVNINIVTNLEGLERSAIQAFSDVIIYIVKNSPNSELEKFAYYSSSFVISSIEDAFDLAGKILEFIRKPIIQPPKNYNGYNISLPKDPTQPFDMKTEVIEKIIDPGSFLEFYEKWNHPLNGPSLITGLCRINGNAIAIIADQPTIMGGAPDSPGTKKFRIFTQFCNRIKVPILMLSNAPGFLPGTKQERLRIQQIGAESLDYNILGEVPVVSVILNQNYGGRQIHAFSKVLRPAITYLAFENSIMAVMGAQASFDLFMGKKYLDLINEGKKDEAVKLKENYIQEFNKKAQASADAYNTGVLDKILTSSDNLREEIIKAFQKSEKEAEYFFNWKRL